jgi:transcription factor CRZ1
VQKHPATFQCSLYPKSFTRAYNLRSHLRTHTDERPYVRAICGKVFRHQHERIRHEGIHSVEKKFVCKGELGFGAGWGCGRRFARAAALESHFKSEAGIVCTKPLLDEQAAERKKKQSSVQEGSSSASVLDALSGIKISMPAAQLAQLAAAMTEKEDPGCEGDTGIDFPCWDAEDALEAGFGTDEGYYVRDAGDAVYKGYVSEGER